MARKVCITAVDGHTGFVIAEILLTNNDFKGKIEELYGLALHPSAAKAKEIGKLGGKVIPHKHGREKDMVEILKQSGCDTLCLIPPTHEEKFDITVELINAARKANVQNVLFISSAGSDLAERDKQPRLREFVDLEALVLSAKGDPNTQLGHSPAVIRAGFYAENLLLYAPQAQNDGVLPIPVGKDHKFAPVALGDVALLAAHVLSSQGKHGFDDRHRGQLMVCTGPLLTTGDELATAASQALGVDMKFEDISEAEAKKVFHHQSQSDVSEKQYLLEYYSLVRDGKTNYISTTAFVNVTGQSPQHPNDFFKVYAEEFKPAHQRKKQKVTNGAQH
ncbi:NAD(P)-binding protein [Aulographum hederae CBS 113979]|uniref:NAD(P)-binding protein n=1 Tax=Aulographum hederae CBS 113979 TaxID=1176131 RepID=A0A6G1HBI7_9PEZI|nr:NAD(P)-binding protein [Aulographum hederae CBS 113979]